MECLPMRIFLLLSSDGIPSSELGANDGCGYGYVQAFRCVSFERIVGDVQFPVDERRDVPADAIAFVPHDNQSVGT